MVGGPILFQDLLLCLQLSQGLLEFLAFRFIGSFELLLLKYLCLFLAAT